MSAASRCHCASVAGSHSGGRSGSCARRSPPVRSSRSAAASGIAQLDRDEKAVELRFRQRIRADLLDGILRRDHEERVGQLARLAVDRHLPLLHRFEQRALRLRRRAVDLVGEHDRMENRPGMEAERLRPLVEDRHAEHVGGQQVARELDARVIETERGGQRLRQRRLPDAGNVLDQQMAAREQAGQREVMGVSLPTTMRESWRSTAARRSGVGTPGWDRSRTVIAREGRGRANGKGKAGSGHPSDRCCERGSGSTVTLACTGLHVISGESRVTLRSAAGRAVRPMSRPSAHDPRFSNPDSPLSPVPTAYHHAPSCRLHDMGPYHPECPERLRRDLRPADRCRPGHPRPALRGAGCDARADRARPRRALHRRRWRRRVPEHGPALHRSRHRAPRIRSRPRSTRRARSSRRWI